MSATKIGLLSALGGGLVVVTVAQKMIPAVEESTGYTLLALCVGLILGGAAGVISARLIAK